jgi:hypothetical protein
VRDLRRGMRRQGVRAGQRRQPRRHGRVAG